jgi:hypothetical protein
VKLEGQHKLATMTWLIAGQHSLHVEAFFCRKPDENHERFYRFLLERNGRTYGVHFAIDPVGDVYLVGRLPLVAAAPGEIDRLLGCVLSYSDENFDAALELGVGGNGPGGPKMARAWRTCARSPGSRTQMRRPGTRQSPGGPGIHGNDERAMLLIGNVTEGQCYRRSKATMRQGEDRAQLAGTHRIRLTSRCRSARYGRFAAICRG